MGPVFNVPTRSLHLLEMIARIIYNKLIESITLEMILNINIT